MSPSPCELTGCPYKKRRGKGGEKKREGEEREGREGEE